jgi:hypothetical protein
MKLKTIFTLAKSQSQSVKTECWKLVQVEKITSFINSIMYDVGSVEDGADSIS